MANDPDISHEDVKGRLAAYSLFAEALTSEIFDAIKEQFELTRRPASYLPASGLQDDIKYEMELRVYEGMYRTDKYVNAMRMLVVPGLRDAVMRLLFSRMVPDEVARSLNTMTGGGVHFTPGDVTTFYHYFCNVSAWSAEQWRMALMDQGYTSMVAAEDVRLGDPEVARFRFGRNLSVQAEDLLDEIMSHVWTRLRVLRQEPTTREVVNQTATLSKIGLHAYDLAANSTRQLEDVYKQLRSIAQTRTNIATPSVNDLLLEDGAEIASPRARSIEEDYAENNDILDAVFEE